MSMQQVPAHRRVVIGVDTHKYVHVAVAINDLGAILESRSFAADSGGYAQLLDWAAGLRGKSEMIRQVKVAKDVAVKAAPPR